jgi:hypothetical protein
MLERDMEDLIAAHPKDFFNRELTLIGRQQSFADVGRFDLLFKDEFGWMILVELKARVAKYEDASQLAKYKDELGRRNTTSVLMWLVAPHIPFASFSTESVSNTQKYMKRSFAVWPSDMVKAFHASRNPKRTSGRSMASQSRPNCNLQLLRHRMSSDAASNQLRSRLGQQ